MDQTPSRPQLLPDEIARTLPPLYTTEHDKEPVARVKLFTPDSSWAWYVTEYDPAKRLCFGLVHGFERELGYFSLNALEMLRGPLGLPIERDLSFEPTPLSQLL